MSGNGRQPLLQRLHDAPATAQVAQQAGMAQAAAGLPGNAVGEQPQMLPDVTLAVSVPMYGLAADLAGLGPSQPADPGDNLLPVRPPARLGTARPNRPAQPPRVPGVRVARGANTGGVAQAAENPFTLMEGQAQQPFPGPDGEAQYGLALELLNNQELGFPGPDQSVEHRTRRAGRPRGNRIARLGTSNRTDAVAASQPPPLDPFTVKEMAASQPGLPEPDYGIVAELRNRELPNPLASDFGLAAEVARRRSRSPSPLSRTAGVLPPLRSRRRLDPVMPPPGSEGGVGYGLADEVAARQQQDAADMAEPFGAAARAGELDPFALAHEQLKVPRELLEPYEATQQEIPGEDVRLKTSGDTVAEPTALGSEKEHYGIAQELGADKAIETRQGREAPGAVLPGQTSAVEYAEQPDPPGHKYTYDEDTGMLVTTAGGQGEGGRVARQYIEDEVTGIFFKLQSKRRKLFGLLRRKPHAIVEDDEEDDKGFRGRLRRTLLFLTNACNVLGMFAQGLLAGFALLNFFMTYMLYSSSDMRKFLSYYAPLAQNNNRIYYALITLSVIFSTSRLAQDKLRDFEPRRLQLGPVDVIQMLMYVGAYVASVLCTPLDDELTYESNRNPRFYELTWTSAFKRRVSLWHALNIIRSVLVGLAWLLLIRAHMAVVAQAVPNDVAGPKIIAKTSSQPPHDTGPSCVGGDAEDCKVSQVKVNSIKDLAASTTLGFEKPKVESSVVSSTLQPADCSESENSWAVVNQGVTSGTGAGATIELSSEDADNEYVDAPPSDAGVPAAGAPPGAPADVPNAPAPAAGGVPPAAGFVDGAAPPLGNGGGPVVANGDGGGDQGGGGGGGAAASDDDDDDDDVENFMARAYELFLSANPTVPEACSAQEAAALAAATISGATGDAAMSDSPSTVVPAPAAASTLIASAPAAAPAAAAVIKAGGFFESTINLVPNEPSPPAAGTFASARSPAAAVATAAGMDSGSAGLSSSVPAGGKKSQAAAAAAAAPVPAKEPTTAADDDKEKGKACREIAEEEAKRKAAEQLANELIMAEEAEKAKKEKANKKKSEKKKAAKAAKKAGAAGAAGEEASAAAVSAAPTAPPPGPFINPALALVNPALAAAAGRLGGSAPTAVPVARPTMGVAPVRAFPAGARGVRCGSSQWRGLLSHSSSSRIRSMLRSQLLSGNRRRVPGGVQFAAAPVATGGTRPTNAMAAAFMQYRSTTVTASAAAAPIPAAPAVTVQAATFASKYDDDEHLCVVCMENTRSILLMPCGHLVLCGTCLPAIEAKGNLCPICRESIQDAQLMAQ
ncbi:hypothetical protein VOLCADRAFT_94594 [Volvox carteri f. nagariensis]|uniref:RING-type domain-containing protein n=1 Tax=Volvox carteri f. nagariensis TaxID=3068 RepID=D8U574_VOLCA|nr:uncharacterized protein VOLCADRAFT_94594 [Volvox carteri f. nagariensis]EFJ45101.1 hypothetical protein VOLCADRAFT_94594 [Volvox carteri f. nagariensis]|eukprot:XP_002953777.1 hypothetical protein VOLCADRAFT_94594 [Volvox carteri f. nagariensis]